jgi:predicted nucleotidyltransferase
MGKPKSAAGPSIKDSLPAKQRFNISGPTLSEFCRKNHIIKLSLFGSVLGNDFRPDSDIDVLVEFEAGHTPGFAIVAMENELSRLAGRKVDLRTPGDLGRHFLEGAIREAEVRYARS